jgi:hypothetical protein
MEQRSNARWVWPAVAAFVLGAAGAAAAAAGDAVGRWEGVAQIPGAPMRVVVDLVRDGPVWSGSVILPGRGVKGAPLQALQVDADGVRFGLAAALRFAPDPPPHAALRWRADGALAGDYTQAGHRAPLVLQRTGEAQVDRPTPPTPIGAELAGRWRGRYELGGLPRDVTLTLTQGATGSGSGELVIVGRRTTTLPVDHVVQTRSRITLESSGAGIRIEGRWQAGTIEGQFVQGPFEAQLTLRRDGAGQP